LTQQKNPDSNTQTRLNLDAGGLKERVKENAEKIKLNNQLPYLVGNIVEVLDAPPEPDEGDEEDGAAADADAGRRGKSVVLKTSTRQTVFLPVVGLVDPATLRPGDLVGVNKDSYLVLDTLPVRVLFVVVAAAFFFFWLLVGSSQRRTCFLLLL